MLEHGYKVRDLFLKGSHFTLSKKKDKVRSRVALARQRVDGLFVNKDKEEKLRRLANEGYLSDESETVCPMTESIAATSNGATSFAGGI